MASQLFHKKITHSRATKIKQSVVQLLGTCLILAFVSGNVSKLLSLLTFWMTTFGRLSSYEVKIALFVNVLFTAMNINAIAHGIFTFTNPDIDSWLPVWELVMWGFYTLHTRRFLDETPTMDLKKPTAIACAFVYSAPFGAISNPQMLFLVSLTLLVLSFVIFHDWMDFAFAGYFVLVGACIEYTGVWSGQWYYPSQPVTGVPLWFVTMWGGVGLYVRRILGQSLQLTNNPIVRR